MTGIPNITHYQKDEIATTNLRKKNKLSTVRKEKILDNSSLQSSMAKFSKGEFNFDNIKDAHF